MGCASQRALCCLFEIYVIESDKKGQGERQRKRNEISKVEVQCNAHSENDRGDYCKRSFLCTDLCRLP